jgi:CHAT domain-containing protein
MQDFYRGLLAGSGQEPARHLRAAKLSMIKSGKYASPHYWAPFVLIGF